MREELAPRLAAARERQFKQMREAAITKHRAALEASFKSLHTALATAAEVHQTAIRKTLAQLGEKVCEQFKAWSQNLGHEKVLTTFSSYGEVAAEQQRDIIRELAQPMDPDPQFQEILKQLMRATKRMAA